ncbi:MAG: hypothetical protein HN742_14410 [Lentisphaerae bacterium]|jgi:rhamnogalacturonan endolyase|nr:hypothetical protein [Lentisphaerota bacterium]MBT4816618.1 hypothetical protein [Lentisphaerota bacterium]MBT5604657.1 hypothetical protein [Lentisphaerota bacterium]MBT7057757.1 hypothetical protein [Lentisphaerota bacterium]MBT7843068.1 hypothetical protein [Lentisphaerota bacterium]
MRKAIRGIASVIVCLATCFAHARGALRFEVENWTTPRDAWQVDKHSDTKWNLWSTDRDADKKWSEGIVLQSPRVMADRETGEEGAPVLHTVIPGIPKGIYDVELSARARPMGISFDGKTWERTSGGLIRYAMPIESGTFELWVDDRFAAENPEGRGSCYYDAIILYPAGPEYLASVLGSGTPVAGWARQRREERLDRGVVALRTPQGVYVGWRLLKDDVIDVAFDLFRRIGDGPETRINDQPIARTTDFLDTTAPEGMEPVYTVRTAGKSGGLFRKLLRRPGDAEGSARTSTQEGASPYVTIKLDGDHTFQKAGIVDLDGDGRLDYVIKQPRDNIDPAGTYWRRSPDTYKIEAYTHDGQFLWRNDLGWAIERGIWYSPYVAHDLDGDGKAEVAAKIGEGDPRNEEQEGRVTAGPEWMVVWDGMTGKEITRVPWPDREGFRAYSRISRNQMAVAYLDGKTPCLLALRGTYDRMKVDAYQLRDGKLELLWTYDNEELSARYQGQGAHFTRAIDVDGDGRDEVMLGSLMLDDTGIPLWTLGLGHNDHAYVGDIDPHRPGLEIYYGIESRVRKNGMCLVDAADGSILWGYGEPTRHIHGTGMCADIDPTVAGLECFGLDCVSKKPDIRKGPWLWAADGALLWFDEPQLPKTYSLDALYWDADLQKELVRGGKITDYLGGPVGRISGSLVLIADVLGDWREEVITSVPGELRIYSSTIPATDRRACLLQDRIYRADITMDTMGYPKEPMTSYCLEAHWPGLNVAVLPGDGSAPTCRVVVSAPLNRRVSGRLTLECTGIDLSLSEFDVEVLPGQRSVTSVALPEAADSAAQRTIVGTFTGLVHEAAEPAGASQPTDPVGPVLPNHDHPVTLYGKAVVKLPGKLLTGLPMVEAEALSGEGGGKVRIRSDKVGTSKDAISHWDDVGHWLEWKITVPKAGTYGLVVRYSATGDVVRKATVDGHDVGARAFPATGGYGTTASDWEHARLARGSTPLKLKLEAGEHTIRLENTDGKGLNLDYLALENLP